MHQEGWLKILTVIAVAGILLSTYLTWNHYQSASVCDFTATISCSLVNSSSYAEIWHVPVALLGVVWFLWLWVMVGKARKREVYFSVIKWWAVIGLLGVLYFIMVEVMLRAICPFCTLVHLLIVAVLVVAITLERSLHLNYSSLQIWKASQGFFWGMGAVLLLLLVSFNLSGEKVNHDQLAKCLTEKGVKMYGSYRCGVCAKTKAMFGDSFQYINEIECHPQGPQSQYELCRQKNIQGTPTWTLEREGVELKRQVGFLSVEQLREFGGCS